MPVPPPPLSADELETLFPAKRPQPIKPGAFELGLVLGGTVSAGAYTGGVLDYLIEALDAWQRAREDGDSNAPPHEVAISTIAGASGGAINGAIMLRAAGWEFDHGAEATNPFYSAWTTGVDLVKLLGTGADGDATGLASLFNCLPIDDQASKTITFNGRPLHSSFSPRHRAYLADPLRLTMMVANVSGLPYSISMNGESGLAHDMVAHADFMRFALTVEKGVPNAPRVRPDELPLCSTAAENWDALRMASLATSAFPLAFRSRPLMRARGVSGYRAVAVPAETGDATIIQLVPKWELLSSGEPDPLVTNFVCVDGGSINNEPIDMVRTALAGLDGRNKRKASEVDRAVILIDPFSDPETLGPRKPPSLGGLVLPFVMSLVYQSRYKPTDLALAKDEDTFSRFLIAPVGPGADGQRVAGKNAIASGGLGGFLGFVDSSFTRYDYALGRLNAYSFLARHLAIPEADKNPIFDGWTEDQRKTYRFTENGVAYLPLIPLMGPLRDRPPPLPKWPVLPKMPDLSDAVTARLDAVYKLAKAENSPDSWWQRALMSSYLWLGWRLYLRGALRDKAVQIIHDGLRDQRLI